MDSAPGTEISESLLTEFGESYIANELNAVRAAIAFGI
jgi:hypothetical protein